MPFLTTSVTVPSVNLPPGAMWTGIGALFILWLLWPFLTRFKRK